MASSPASAIAFFYTVFRPAWDSSRRRSSTPATRPRSCAKNWPVIAGLFARAGQEPPPRLSDPEIERFEAVTALAVRLRAHIERDRRSRVIESVHDPEGQGRIGLSLERLLAGLSIIGLAREDALRLIDEIALASTPPIRRRAFGLLSPTPRTTREIALALQLPTTTVHRALEDLFANGLALRGRQTDAEGVEKKGGADLWRVDPRWAGKCPGIGGFSQENSPVRAPPETLSRNNTRVVMGGDGSLNGYLKISEYHFERDCGIDPISAANSLTEQDFRAKNGQKQPISGAGASTRGRPAAPGGKTPPDVIVTGARRGGVLFVLDPERPLFTLEWRGPFDPLINDAIKDNYAAILAWLIHEAGGGR
jgi:hypothetical protein